jgi:hypothetical protein
MSDSYIELFDKAGTNATKKKLFAWNIKLPCSRRFRKVICAKGHAS